MNIIDAMKELKSGSKIRNKNWSEGRYVYSNIDEFLEDETGNVTTLNINDMLAEFEVYEEPKEGNDMKKVEELIDNKIKGLKKEIKEFVNREIDDAM